MNWLSYPFKVETAVTQYEFVKLGTNAGEVVPAGAGDNAIGVAQATAAAGENVNVVIFGETYIAAGEALAANAVVKCDATGRATDVATALGDYALGVVLEAATAAGDQVKMLFGVGNSGRDQV